MVQKEKMEQLLGMKTEPRWMEYTWRDVALYALAIGAKSEDISYTYEKDLKALPTFGTLPYWGTINVQPYQWMPLPASMFANDLLQPTTSFLNMDHEIILHRPIDPIKGTFQYQDQIIGVYDRGEGKGTVIKTELVVRNEAGVPVCTNYSSTFFHEGGGFGGAPMPKSSVEIPYREPDAECDDYISPVQNMLYRLTGDTNLIHCDPEYAQKMGMEKPIMQGLCSFGFACRMAISCLFPGEPERLKRMAAQMSSVLYPDTPIRLQLWRMAEKEVYFRLINLTSGKPILNRGLLQWE